MRAVVQRVRQASVRVGASRVGAIGLGLVVLVAVGSADTADDARWLAHKVAGLRVFPDDRGRMGHSVRDVGGSLLVISQFTLYGDVSRGFRPDFARAAPAEAAETLYVAFVEACRAEKLAVATGVFRAEMEVELLNWGPVSLVIESPEGGLA
ncbi:MAG: D-aminoacyl-tRNA deacylase [Thermaerobacter sp.]|nr:D-aminoacyl-tRNA deacylase [Thermaerobacter sp.]